MTEIQPAGIDAKAAIARAKREIADEHMRKGVDKLKVKLRELETARVVYENCKREVADLEASIEQGNI